MTNFFRNLFNLPPVTSGETSRNKQLYFIHTKPNGEKVVRIVSGILADEFMLDYSKSISELRIDVEQLLDYWVGSNVRKIEEQLGKFPKSEDIGVHQGSNHIDVVFFGKGSLGWLTIADHYASKLVKK